ncbi:uncharacterized protein LOC122512005 [Leptopilina heterotoma]|uniref:uncharacterized protein LOC122512005 n=1 Tax=Leptopilina heterotoma TaxID=63436 RepID=UPI001CA92BCD|nr:uncharacterized protein LOC122512005 [Leptopilina heterotoma]
MKLSTAIYFNKTNLKFEGFTDLGEWTPEHQKQKKGDHALVFMYQPFRGSWVQTHGCFLSVGCASGTVLHKLLLECILLIENSGFFVDAVVTDGASWNRYMWNIFGVTDKDISVPHPCCDAERRLWFFSDFPHLIKALRNFLIKLFKYAVIYTPDGNISLKHWYALLELLGKLSYELRVNYKLRLDHVEPKYYQKMNVALAFQFFNIHHALEIYNDCHEDLEDCNGTITFCKRITSLIKAMNSRTAFDAMAPNNEAWKTIEDFILFLEEWESNAKGKLEFMSDNCCYGMKISLKAVLEICTFLTEKCNFSYLMTARVN